MKTDDETAINISGTVFVYALLATLGMSLIGGTGAVLFAWRGLERESELHANLSDISLGMATCRVDRSTLEGRLHTFQSLFIRSQMTAITSAIREFETHAGVGGDGRPLTVDQFKTWTAQR